MDYISLLGISIGLSMDAFAAAITSGATNKNLNIINSLKISISFGFFQSIMPILGWLIGMAGESLIKQVDHWIAFILLCYIGGKMIYDSVKGDFNTQSGFSSNHINFKFIIVMAIATSIDALATGVILPSIVGANSIILMIYSVTIIGVITFFISFIGTYIGKKFGSLINSKAQALGGGVLIFIGAKILVEHLFLSH